MHGHGAGHHEAIHRFIAFTVHGYTTLVKSLVHKYLCQKRKWFVTPFAKGAHVFNIAKCFVCTTQINCMPSNVVWLEVFLASSSMAGIMLIAEIYMPKYNPKSGHTHIHTDQKNYLINEFITVGGRKHFVAESCNPSKICGVWSPYHLKFGTKFVVISSIYLLYLSDRKCIEMAISCATQLGILHISNQQQLFLRQQQQQQQQHSMS